jgi:hypothetical protein
MDWRMFFFALQCAQEKHSGFPHHDFHEIAGRVLQPPLRLSKKSFYARRW